MVKHKAWGLCSIEYPSEMLLKPKSHEIPFVYNLFLSYPETAVPCAKFQNDWSAEMDVMDERDLGW